MVETNLKSEKLIILAKCRVKEDNTDGDALLKKRGDIVTVSGLDKVELLNRKLAAPFTEELDKKIKAESKEANKK